MTILTNLDYFNDFVKICNENKWKILFNYTNSNNITENIEIEFEKFEQCRKDTMKDFSDFKHYWNIDENEEIIENFENYVKQAIYIIHENNWYIHTNNHNFITNDDLYDFIINFMNYQDENEEILEENQHSDEESEINNIDISLMSVNQLDSFDIFENDTIIQEDINTLVRVLSF